MKRFNPLLIIIALLGSLLFSCGDKPQITDIQLKKDRLPLYIGASETLSANLLPLNASAKMVWTTSNSKVAAIEVENDKGTITKCVVTAKSVGTATITVSTKDGKHSAVCEVTVIDINVDVDFIIMQGGTFTMGCTDGDCHSSGNEEPAHEVTLSSFKIAKYPVTQLQWEAIMGNNPSYFEDESNPVERVSLYDVQKFIQKLNEVTGKQYRLPTESEWEYAARGGIKSKGYKFSGSDNYDEV